MKVLTVLSLVCSLAYSVHAQSLALSPPWRELSFSVREFKRADDSYDSSPCDTSRLTWLRFPGKDFDIHLSASGPGGSGRYWDITIGIVKTGKRVPVGGFCFTTSTVGWRTLQSFDQVPIKWVDDLDGDGNPELIVWSSFPLAEEPSNAEMGLIAWVYQIDPKGKCRIDYPLSQRLARDVAAAYRKPVEPHDSYLAERRSRAATMLEQFSRAKDPRPR